MSLRHCWGNTGIPPGDAIYTDSKPAYYNFAEKTPMLTEQDILAMFAADKTESGYRSIRLFFLRCRAEELNNKQIHKVAD